MRKITERTESEWRQLFVDALEHINWTTKSRYSGRNTMRHRGKYFNVTVTIKDKSKPNFYSRLELTQMLLAVRREEKRMGWKVPEFPKNPAAPIVCVTSGNLSIASDRGKISIGGPANEMISTITI